MAAEKPKAKAAEKPKVDPSIAEVQKRNKGIDVFARCNAYDLHLPDGSDPAFMAKAKYFDIPSRLGEGPCVVEIKFAMPNGDMATVGDTFDPIIERMSLGKYRSLKQRKFFSATDEGMDNKMIEHSEKTKKK